MTEMAGTIDLRKARQVIEKKAAAPDHEVETSCVVCSHGRASSCTHGHDHVDQHPLDLMICDRYVRKILEQDNTQKDTLSIQGMEEYFAEFDFIFRSGPKRRELAKQCCSRLLSTWSWRSSQMLMLPVKWFLILSCSQIYHLPM